VVGGRLIIMKLIIPILIIFFSVNNLQAKTIEYSDLQHRLDGMYYEFKSETPFTGTAEIYRKSSDFMSDTSTDGTIFQRIGMKQGRKHGEHIVWNDNGSLREKENYINGKKGGEQIY